MVGQILYSFLQLLLDFQLLSICKNLVCYSIHALQRNVFRFKQLALKPYYSHTNDLDYLNDIQQLNGRILYQHFHQSSPLLKSQNLNLNNIWIKLFIMKYYTQIYNAFSLNEKLIKN